MREARDPLDALALFLSRISEHVSPTLIFDILAALAVIALAVVFIRNMKHIGDED